MSNAPSRTLFVLPALACLLVGLACADDGSGLPIADAGGQGGGAGKDGAAGSGGGGGNGGGGGTDGGGSTDAAPGGDAPREGGASDAGRDGGGQDRTPDGFGTDAPAPSPGKVACGTMTCDTATQECCRTFDGGGGSSKCIAKGGTCMGAVTGCDEKGDCADGAVCCQTLGGGGSTPAMSECTPADMCTGRGTVQRCSSDADCPAAASKCCSYGFGMMSFSGCRSSC